MRKLDLKENIFGSLKVVDEYKHKESGPVKWVCKCTCGKTSVVTTSNLRSGHTTSCGCHRAEVATKHGLHKTYTYSSWEKMIQRCCNKMNINYKNYGGKGITVCEKWKNSFADFLADMGERPKGTSIDRIDNSKDYYKENCRWATESEQKRNTSRNVWYVYNGKRYCQTDIAKELGINACTFKHRFDRGHYQSITKGGFCGNFKKDNA